MHIFVSLVWIGLFWCCLFLFVKTNTRHVVCRPTLLPAAMVNFLRLLPASGLASCHNLSQFRGVWDRSGGSRWEFITVLVPNHCFLTRKLSLVRRMKANYNHRQTSGNTLEFLGRFKIHTYPAPPLTPQTTLDACFQNFSASVATLYRAEEGEIQENFEKDALFYCSLCSYTLLSPPICCCNSCLFWVLNAIHKYR